MNAEQLAKSQPSAVPADLGPCVIALCHAAHGEWETAHELVQHEAGADAAWVHAWLHRYEGDLANAAYWYRRACRPVEDGDLDSEWRSIATELLARHD